MYSAFLYNRLRVLSTLLGFLIAFTSTAADAPNRIHDSDRFEIYDLSLPQLTKIHFESLDADLSMLRISRSKIDRIDRHAFDSLKHMNLLEMSDCKIKEVIPPETFSDLPALEILILRNIGLRNVAFNLTNVQELVLAQNEIEDVEENAIKGKNVNYLDLSDNKIKILENSMSSVKKLAMIDLSNNRIEFVGENVFKDNPNLIRILASKNKMTSTNGLRYPKLRTLDLYGNNLSTLPSDAFYKMSVLEDLVLAFNNIKDIEDPFKDLEELKFLNLAWNNIEEVRPDLFRNNLYLSQLSLEGNKIKNLKRFVSVHEHLVKLDLSQNELSHIDSDFFLSMPNLNELDLALNRLKVFTDILKPLGKLKVLNAAFNELYLRGDEFAENQQMTQLNLTSNFIDVGLKSLANNSMLTTVDLTGNVISNFCDDHVTLKKLRNLYLRNNKIQNLSCLINGGFKSLCLVDLRNNPFNCGNGFNEFVSMLAFRKVSPFRNNIEVQTDIVRDQCEILTEKDCFTRWNLVKNEICPGSEDVTTPPSNSNAKAVDKYVVNEAVENNDHKGFSEDDYLTSDESYVDSSEEQLLNGQFADETQLTKDEVKEKHFIIIPIGRLTKESFKVSNEPKEDYQSEKVSWEQINRHPDLVNDYEEDDLRLSHYNWYTVVFGLIGICLTLTCFNLLVFLYIRLKIWRRSEMNNPQRYTFLKNEVYKNTTEPTESDYSKHSLWFPKDNSSNGKIFSYEKINEFFQNFGTPKKDADTESTKNILIPPNSDNPHV